MGQSSKVRRGPDFIRFFQPVLDALKEKDSSATPREVCDWVIDNLNISDEELAKTNKNGQSNFENKVAFARYYLTVEGFLDGNTRGVWSLTEKGRRTDLSHVDALKIFDAVTKKQKEARESGGRVDKNTPTEDVEQDDSELLEQDPEFDWQQETKQHLRKHLLEMSANGFEEFSAYLLRRLGLDNVQAQGGSGDQGIDGVGELRVSRFMRTRVAYQCKKYQDSNSVTPTMVRDFRGAISGRVDRGLFLTTSKFTKAAREEASRENVVPIELIDIEGLLEIIIDEKVGVEEVKALKINSAFFEKYKEQSTGNE